MGFATRGDCSLLLQPPSIGQPAGPLTSETHRQREVQTRPPFASLTATSGTTRPLTTFTERRTGVAFPGEFCLEEGARGCPVLSGAGVRRKRLAGIKNLDVYALGLYVAEAAARRELRGRFAGAAPDALAADQALFDELARRQGIEKTLRIVITSGLVKRRSFLDALNERLAPALKAAGAEAALEAFQRQFDAARFRKGLEISFTWTPAGRLVTKVDGEQVGALSSRELRKALLDVYVGRDPVSADAKASFGRGLAAMVLA
eukprot:scaffold2.g7281.t1